MANSVDLDQRAKNANSSKDLDQTVPKKTVYSLTLIRLLRMAKRVDPGQTAENGKQCRP